MKLHNYAKNMKKILMIQLLIHIIIMKIYLMIFIQNLIKMIKNL